MIQIPTAPKPDATEAERLAFADACRVALAQTAAPDAQPVAYTIAGKVTDWSRDFSKCRTQHHVRPVYAAAGITAAPTTGE